VTESDRKSSLLRPVV